MQNLVVSHQVLRLCQGIWLCVARHWFSLSSPYLWAGLGIFSQISAWVTIRCAVWRLVTWRHALHCAPVTRDAAHTRGQCRVTISCSGPRPSGRSNNLRIDKWFLNLHFFKKYFRIQSYHRWRLFYIKMKLKKDNQYNLIFIYFY